MENNESLSILVNKLQIEHTSTQNQSEQEQFESLVAYIEDLINNDFNKLISILYRMDVSEEKLKKTLANDNGEQSQAHIIATLMIEREIQKIKLRAKYKKENGS